MSAHAPEQTASKLDLPEEFPLIKSGDTLILYNNNAIKHVEFYHEHGKYPVNSKLYVVR